MADGNIVAGWLPNLTAVCSTSLHDHTECVNTKGQQLSGLVDVHLKTKFKAHTDAMYRIKIEGYAYGDGADSIGGKPISSEVVGYLLSPSTTGPDAASIVNGNGLGAESKTSPYAGLVQEQYYSKDGYLVLRMTVSHYCTSLVLTASVHYVKIYSIEGTSIWIASANSTERL
jgi:hypothetical protein